MAVRVARQYHKHRLDFSIITSYDPQRGYEEQLSLENVDLPSERVYNVDSFQGRCHSHHTVLGLPLPAWLADF